MSLLFFPYDDKFYYLLMWDFACKSFQTARIWSYSIDMNKRSSRPIGFVANNDEGRMLSSLYYHLRHLHDLKVIQRWPSMDFKKLSSALTPRTKICKKKNVFIVIPRLSEIVSRRTGNTQKCGDWINLAVANIDNENETNIKRIFWCEKSRWTIFLWQHTTTTKILSDRTIVSFVFHS